MLGTIKQNIGFAIRTLFKNKGFTITAVLTLALGIGATTAIFSVVYAVFEPMPYPNPDQLVMVWSKTPAETLYRPVIFSNGDGEALRSRI